MNQSTRRKTRHLLHFLLTWVIICTQIALPLGALLAAVQPTPQMAQAVATEFGWSDWLADRSADFLALGQRFWGEPATAQATITYGAPTPLLSTTHSATITTGRTGLCTALNCFIANAANVVDSSTTNFGNISIPLGLVGGVYFSVDTNTIFPAGYRAGFLVDNGGGLIDLSLFSSFSIKTYLNGTLQETAASGALLDVALFGGANSNAISFVTTKAFDEVRLEAGSLIGALLDLDVYYAFVQEPTYSVAAAPGGVTSGLRAWVKADVGAGASDGATVATWSDQSGNGYNFTQATTGAQPTYYATTSGKLLNFNPVLDFDGTGDYLRNTTVLMPSSSPYTFLAVGVDEDTGTGYRKIFGSEAIVDYFGLYKQGGATGDNGWVPYAIGGQARSSPFIGDRGSMGKGTKYSAEGGANGYWNGTNFTSDSRTDYAQPQIVGFNSLNSATSDPFYTWTDGYKEDPNWSPIVDGLVFRNQFFTQTSIGADITVELWKGRIPEFMAYSQSLSDSDIAKINTYLAIKYGITLGQGNGHVGKNGNNYNYVATDGAVIWNASANIGYAYNIAGIGRDDAEDLMQKQSQSIQAGFQPVIGIGAIAATNAANTGAFSTNKNYLLWGDNGQAATFATVYTPTSFTPAAGYYRMNRVWKVQETGTITNVVVQATGTDHLLVSSDPTFATGVTEIDMSSGSATVNFTDGQFFTFGAAQIAPGGVAFDLAFWYKPEAGVTLSGDKVSSWVDQANGIAVTPAATNNGPTYYDAGPELMNFNPVLNFTNATRQDGLRAASGLPAIPNGVSTFSVLLPDDASNRWFLQWGVSNFGYYNNYGHCNANNPGVWTNSHGGCVNNPTTLGPITTPSFLSVRWNSTAGTNQWQLRRNGQLHSGTTTAATLNVPADTALEIGDVNNRTAGNEYIGNISEVIGYTSRLSDTDRQKVESYLAIKYGITYMNDANTAATDYLNSAGAKVWDATANSADAANIAGIGRDDASALQQKQSQSVNGGFQPIIGLGTIATSNAANSSAFAANVSFLLWGDNNAATTLSAGYNGGSNNRVARVWKVQESGTVGAVTVVIPRSAFPTVGLRSLIVHSSDANFGTVDRTYPLVSTGGNYEVTVDFNNGDFFTFSSSSTLPEINVTPTTIDFGTVNSGSTSPAQAVTIQNQGDVTLNISSIALSGSDAARFAISSNNCGATLSAGASCTVQITFTPTTAGNRSALLVITNKDSDESTVNVALSGATPSSSGGGTTGTYNLAVTKSASVSNATIGTPFTYTITVLNKGTIAASNVVMTDQLPAGVTFGSANATGGGNCTHNSGTVTCTWASLSGGASATVTISVTP